MQFFLFASLLVAAAASPLSANGDNGASNTNGTPFVEIKDLQVCVTEHRYTTPAVVLIGTDTQLLRCLSKDPEQCEVMYTTGSNVKSLLLVGDFIYAGLSNKILRCNLTQAESCKIYQTCDNPVQSLTTANGYLYAGMENGTVLNCRLDEFNSCRSFHTFENSVYALMQENEYIYVGVWNGKVMRCSLGSESSCRLMHTLSGGISGLSSVGNSIFAVLFGDQIMWKCVKKTDAIGSCESSHLDYRPIDMAIFDGSLYTAKHGGYINICQWENHNNCTVYKNNILTSSFAFSYATYAMQSQYRGEDRTCLWQSKSECPPGITYYNSNQRAVLEVHVKEGRLYNSQGTLVDTSTADEGHAGPAAIFAMGPDGRILLSNVHRRGSLHTSSFFAGKPVAGAGEMVVENGVIQKIRACSAHYLPDTDLNRQVVQSLRVQGYTDHIDSVMCNEGENNQSNLTLF